MSIMLFKKNWTVDMPHFEYHKNIFEDSDMEDTSCSHIMEVSWDEMCKFTQVAKTCHEMDMAIDYMNLIFCKFQQNPNILTLTVLILFIYSTLLIAFMIINLITCTVPNFMSLCRFIDLDEYTTGSVLLGLVNGLPDVFHSLVMDETDSEILINQRIGIGVVLLGLYIGIQATWFHIKLEAQYFLRDMAFLLFGAIIFIYISSATSITLLYSILLNVIYILYLMYVLIEYSLSRANYKTGRNELQRYDPYVPLNKILKSSKVDNNEVIEDNFYIQFLKSLQPIKNDELTTVENWQKYILKYFCIIRWFLIFLVPTVNYDLMNNGWSRLLNSLHFITMPLLLLIFFNYRIVLYIMAAGIVLSILSFFTTKTAQIPKFHFVFIFLGLVWSSFINLIVVSELCAIGFLFGSLLGLRRQMAAVTILSWITCSSDIVLNRAIAHLGYYKMSVASYYGSQIFQILFSIGIKYLHICLMSPTYTFEPRMGEVGSTNYIFLFLLLIFSTIYLSIMGFQLRSAFGYFTAIIFIVYLIFKFLIEYEVIHGHGSDHKANWNLLSDWA